MSEQKVKELQEKVINAKNLNTNYALRISLYLFAELVLIAHKWLNTYRFKV